jgi:hypothetical protein
VRGTDRSSAVRSDSGANWLFLACWSTHDENRPYLLPETLRELVGPVTGAVQLPLRLDWSDRAEFHLDDPAERNVMYERVIREAIRIDDLCAYLNGALLREAWQHIFLPQCIRQTLGRALPRPYEKTSQYF